MKKHKLGLICGRFSPIHKGHQSIINTSIEKCDKTLIFIGSAQESGTLRNPLSADFRIDLLRKVYPDKNIVQIEKLEDMTNEYDINSKRAEWKDILAVYTVKISNGKNDAEVMTLDNNKISILKEIFWEMNEITSKPEQVTKDVMLGKADIHDAMSAIAQSELTVQAATTITGKILQTYEKIMQIQI